MTLLRLIIITLILVVPAAIITGCNIASGIVYVTTPNPVSEAKYELENRPTVVFIDDRRNQVNPVRFRREIADVASEDLIAEEVVLDVISPRDALTAARQLDRGNQPASLGRVGELVGADQVIYVEMLRFTLSRDGISPDPYASCRIRVIDIPAQKRVFPAVDGKEPDAFLLEVTLPIEKSQGLTNSRVRQQIGEALAKETGTRIAQLFYDHEIPAVGANLLYR